MNKKILLNILCPATKKTYDFWIPSDMSLHDANTLIVGALESREKNLFSASSDTTLMSKETGDLLDNNRTLDELGLLNGSQLVLV